MHQDDYKTRMQERNVWQNTSTKSCCSPSKSIWPSLTVSRPAIILSKVVLPAKLAHCVWIWKTMMLDSNKLKGSRWSTRREPIDLFDFLALKSWQHSIVHRLCTPHNYIDSLSSCILQPIQKNILPGMKILLMFLPFKNAIRWNRRACRNSELSSAIWIIVIVMFALALHSNRKLFAIHQMEETFCWTYRNQSHHNPVSSQPLQSITVHQNCQGFLCSCNNQTHHNIWLGATGKNPDEWKIVEQAFGIITWTWWSK